MVSLEGTIEAEERLAVTNLRFDSFDFLTNCLMC